MLPWLQNFAGEGGFWIVIGVASRGLLAGRPPDVLASIAMAKAPTTRHSGPRIQYSCGGRVLTMIDAAAERNWRDGAIYWSQVAGLILATAVVIGLWLLADHTIQRDIPYPEITETGAIIFNCEAEHRVGAQIWLKIDDDTGRYPVTEARACFDFSKRRWYVKNLEQYVPWRKTINPP